MYKLDTSFTLCPWNFSIHILLGRTINKTQLRTHKSVAYFLYFLLFMYPLTSKYFLESDVPVSLHPLVFLIFHISLYSLIFHISLYSFIFLYLCILYIPISLYSLVSTVSLYSVFSYIPISLYSLVSTVSLYSVFSYIPISLYSLVSTVSLYSVFSYIPVILSFPV